MVASRTQRQGVVVEILIDHKIGMNHNLESIRIDSTDSDSISVQIANRITMGESIRKASKDSLQRGWERLEQPPRAPPTTHPTTHTRWALIAGAGKPFVSSFSLRTNS